MSIRNKMRAEINEPNLLNQAKAFAVDYLANVENRNVYPTPEAIQNLKHFEESLPLEPSNSTTILEMLHQYGSPATVTQTGGRYFGFVNGATVPAGLAARWLSDTWDQNYALYVMSPIAAKLESICQDWLVGLLGLPQGTVAGFVDGTSNASICGLVAARDHLLRQQGWDIKSKGLYEAPKIRLVVGKQAHSSIIRALSILGLGKEQIEWVDVDNQGRFMAESMPKLDNNTLVILQAGNVNSGAFDPFDEVCDQANEAGAWVHIDGAFGLWAAASERYKYLSKGMEKADSWSVDAHKTLNAPYDSGIVFCKNASALGQALHSSGAYIQYSEERDGMQFTTAMSRRARSIELWATLKFLGKSGIEELIDGLCERAQQFTSELRKSGFRILNNIVFNQILVACETPEQTQTLLSNLQNSGELWCGGSTWFGEPVIRISVCSWRTTAENVSHCVNVFNMAYSKTLYPET